MGLARTCARASECASRQNSSPPRSVVFVHVTQALEASSKNALAYDDWSSGPIIYAYVGGNPLRYTDPSGLCPMCLIPALPYIPELVIVGATWWASQQVKTPNSGPPGGWITNPGNGQERLYGPGGRPEVDIDWHPDHGAGTPHGHNWDDDGKRGPGVPLSPWPPGRTPQSCPAK